MCRRAVVIGVVHLRLVACFFGGDMPVSLIRTDWLLVARLLLFANQQRWGVVIIICQPCQSLMVSWHALVSPGQYFVFNHDALHGAGSAHSE